VGEVQRGRPNTPCCREARHPNSTASPLFRFAKAKGEGKYKGRKPTARAKADGINRLAAEGLTREAIAAQLGVSVRSVYRMLGRAA
jgi:DNA-binding NarL/FixJ family response regulator